MKAILYLRVSTQDQKDAGHSLQAQRTVCELEAKKRGIKKKLIFEEVISGSAQILDRPQLMQALMQLKKGDLFIVYSRDRIARDITIIFNVERIIQKSGSHLICIAEQDTQMHGSRLMQTRLIDLIAEHERLILKNRTALVLQENKQHNKRVGTIPFGFQLASDGIHLEPNVLEQEIIGLAVRLRKQQHPYAQITQKINAQGYVNRKGNMFSITQVHRMVMNKKNEHSIQIPSSIQMSTIVKDLRLQGHSLGSIQKEVASRGFTTKKGKPLHVTHIARILKRSSIQSPLKRNNAPFGFKPTPSGIRVCDKEQEIIALAHKLRKQGNPLQSIVEYINAQGYRSRVDNPFQLTQIVRMLHKPIAQ